MGTPPAIRPDNFSPLRQSFYLRSAKEVAPDLLGHWLLRRFPAGLAGGPIVETEAYLRDDPACHASRGQTRRNTVMFGPPGRAYVYYIYGMYHCVNAVCMPEGTPEAVLIRAIEPRIGQDIMLKHRLQPAHLADGPGKLCDALAIGLPLNGLDLCNPDSEIFIARDFARPSLKKSLGPTAVSQRIGISMATTLPLRFALKGSACLSRKT